MNAVVFQISARGDAYYPSERLPWAYNLSGVPGRDPGWDPLQFVIDEAGKRGLEVHAWFNPFAVSYVSHNDSPASADIPNVRFSNPEWMEGAGWMNPGYPDAREWQVANVLEVIENYDIDAIHFDRIRYNTGGYPSDAGLYSDYNPDGIVGLDNWRRHNITEFIRLVYEGIQEIRPTVKIGVTPVGHYNSQSSDGWGALYGATSVYQDSRGWAQKGYIDYIAPQVYWDIGRTDPPRFTYIVNDWVQYRRNDRHLYIGIGAHHHHIRNEIGAQIDTTRSRGTEGQIYFRNDNIASSSFSGRYDNKALVPPMPWRSMNKPNTVKNLQIQNNEDSVALSWEEPDPGRGETDPRFRYVIYRAKVKDIISDQSIISNPQNIIEITGELTFEDKPKGEPDGLEYAYYVTSVSRNNVESDFQKVEIEVVSAENEESLPHSLSLEQNYPNPFNPTTNIHFSLPNNTYVQLDIFDITGQRVATLLDERVNAGTHSVVWDATGHSSGLYLYRLQADGYTKTKSMTLMK